MARQGSKRTTALNPLPRRAHAQSITLRPIAELVPYARNARTHSDAQIAQVAASIREFGWTFPVLVDEHSTIIAGHGRVLAAHQLGLDRVPTITAKGWSDAQIKAYRLADNKLTDLSSWDMELLTLELGELVELGVVDLTGFSPVELDSLLSPNTLPEDIWQGMPDVSQGSIEAFRSIVVHFMSQADVDAFAAAIGQTLTAKAKWVWFPAQERQTVTHLRYAEARNGQP